jgi:fluoride exporter
MLHTLYCTQYMPHRDIRVNGIFVAWAPLTDRPNSRQTAGDMERFLWICLAGAVGTASRYLIAIWAAQRFGSAFPYGTLIVNLAGCFLIAAVMESALLLGWSATLRSALTIGFLGGLTTYSSFNYETTRLVEEGAVIAAALNVTLTGLGGFMAGVLGLLTVRGVFGR